MTEAETRAIVSEMLTSNTVKDVIKSVTGITQQILSVSLQTFDDSGNIINCDFTNVAVLTGIGDFVTIVLNKQPLSAPFLVGAGDVFLRVNSSENINIAVTGIFAINSSQECITLVPTIKRLMSGTYTRTNGSLMDLQFNSATSFTAHTICAIGKKITY